MKRISIAISIILLLLLFHTSTVLGEDESLITDNNLSETIEIYKPMSFPKFKEYSSTDLMSPDIKY